MSVTREAHEALVREQIELEAREAELADEERQRLAEVRRESKRAEAELELADLVERRATFADVVDWARAIRAKAYSGGLIPSEYAYTYGGDRRRLKVFAGGWLDEKLSINEERAPDQGARSKGKPDVYAIRSSTTRA